MEYTDQSMLEALHRDGRPRPPLIVAASMGRHRAVNALLDRDVNVNARRADGETALHAAVRSSHGGAALVDRLLDEGACLDAQDARAGLKPLDVSVFMWGVRSAVTALLVHSNRLAKAVVRHDVDAVEFLLACGISPNFTTEAYGSPLHVAVRHRQYRMMAAIVSSNRSRAYVRHKGVTPVDYAMSMDDGRAVRIIMRRHTRRYRRTRHLSLQPSADSCRSRRPSF